MKQQPKNQHIKAETIADIIQINYNVNADQAFEKLLEMMFDLSHQKFDSSFETWENYKSFITQVGLIFSDPNVSGKLEKCFHKKAFKMFNELIYFFDNLSNDEHLQNFLLAYNLKHWNVCDE